MAVYIHVRTRLVKYMSNTCISILRHGNETQCQCGDYLYGGGGGGGWGRGRERERESMCVCTCSMPVFINNIIAPTKV